MNIFTNDDYRRIQAWLKANAIKDSDLTSVDDTIPEEDTLVLVQKINGILSNVKISIKNLLNSTLGKVVIDTIIANAVKVNNTLTVTASNVKIDNEKGTTLQDIIDWAETIENTAKGWKIEHQAPSIDEPTVRAKYVLKDSKGVPKGDSIKVYKDSAVTNVYLGTTEDICNENTGEVTKKPIQNNNEALSIVYRLDTGKYSLVNVPIGIFIREAEFDKYRGLGITENGQVFIKLANDVESSNYLHFNDSGELSADGIENRILQDLGTIINSVAGDSTMWGQYKKEEGTKDSPTNEASRWGQYKQAEADRNERLNNLENKFEETEQEIIYDVSARNDGAVFESLQALLSSSNLSTLIPTSVRHGGMSIRFIQGSVSSSDNKYVQYRLMSTYFSTNKADWQGVDDEPIAGSDNLVKSGGVYENTKKLSNINIEILQSEDDLIDILDDVDNTVVHIDENGVTVKDLIITDVNVLESLGNKVEKVEGKQLSTEDYSTEDKEIVEKNKKYNISIQEILQSEDEIIIYDKNDEEVVKITGDGIDAKKLKIKGTDILRVIKEISNVTFDYGSLQERCFIKTSWPYYFEMYFDNRELQIPTTYNEESYLDRKIREVPKGKSFIFVTDTHWVGNKKKSNYLIDYVRKRLGIEKVVFGGDAIQSGNDKYVAAQELVEYSEEFFSSFGKNSIWCQGNHDGNYVSWLNHRSDVGADINDWIISDVEGYKRTVKYIEDKVVFDDISINAINALESYTETQKAEIIAWVKMHYYIDDDKNKIRYIVYETGNGGYTEAIICNTSYQNMDILQWNWLATTLRSTPVDYDIVILGHMFGNAALELETRKIISAFKGRKKANMDNSKYSSNTLVSQPIFNALYGTTRWNEYDFSDCPSRTGKVFIVNGHWHIDAALEYHGNYEDKYDTTTVIRQWNNEDTHADDAVLNIWVDRDVYGDPGTPQFGGAGNTKESNSVTEQSFDVITITDDGIYCTRFGAGVNRYFNY